MKTKIRVISKKTEEQKIINDTYPISAIEWDDGDKYFSSREISRIVKEGEIVLGEKYFAQFLTILENSRYDYTWQPEPEPEPQPEPTRWQDEPATQKQYDYIKLLGYGDIEHNLTKGQASQVIDMIKSGEASAINLFKTSVQPTNEIYGDFG